MRSNLILLCLLCLVAARVTASNQALQQLIDQGKFSEAASQGEVLLRDRDTVGGLISMPSYKSQYFCLVA